MSAKWPDTTVLKRGSMKGGGDRGAKKVSMLQITIRTTMPCGEQLETSARVRKEHEANTERTLHDDIRIAARGHLRTCKKCNAK